MSSSTCFMSWLTFVVLLADQRRELASVFALNIISYYVLYWHSNSHLDVGCHTELFMRRKWEKVRGCDRDFWSVSAFVFEWYRWFLPPRLQEKAWTPGKAISCYFKFWASCGQVGLHDLIMPCFIRNHVRRIILATTSVTKKRWNTRFGLSQYANVYIKYYQYI